MWPPALENQDVLLRPLQSADREAVFAALTTFSDISLWTRIPYPYERAHLDQFFASVDAWHRSRTDAVFAIIGPESDDLLGCCGVHRIGGDYKERSSLLPDEPGYWLAPDARGRGLMTAGLRLACNFLHNDCGRPLVNIQTKVGNTRSRAVIERVGFVYTETVYASAVDDDATCGDCDRFVLRQE